jgi:putative ABC transport system permease protein
MTARDTLAMALGNLARRRGRTALTAAGVTVGVAALVLMVSLGLGLKRQLLRLFETDDSLRTLSVTRVKAEDGAKKRTPFSLFDLGGQIAPMTDKDLEQIQALPGAPLAVPDFNMLLRASIHIPGFTPDFAFEFFPVAGVHPAEESRYAGVVTMGRMWRPGERACLLPTALAEGILKDLGEFEKGTGVRKELLPSTVRFGAVAGDDDEPAKEKLEFAVVGIVDSDRLGIRGRQIFLPLEEAKELRRATKGGFSFFPYKEGTYPAVEVRVADPRGVNDARARLRNMGYNVLGASDVIESINLIFLIVEGFLACIGAIGLVVSLFGIANTMAMAVLERTREIGIMKALGARKRDVGRVFLAEAAAIGALGGAAGLALGFLAGSLLDGAAHGLMDLPRRVNLFHVTPWLAAGSVVFSVMVSVLAGAVPARRAARLDPVAALRYE